MSRKEELELDLIYYKNKIRETQDDIDDFESLMNFNKENLMRSIEKLKGYKNIVKQIREKIKECEE